MASTTSTSTPERKATSIDRTWIAKELAKEIDVQRAFASETKARADAPPEPATGVLYHEIAVADERHATMIERVATRYGHVPSQSQGSPISNALGHLKEKIVELGREPIEQLSLDLAAKARSVQWLTAWSCTFEAIGEIESSRELAAVLAEEQAHVDALQQSLNRLVEQHARAADQPANGQQSASPAG